jgi:DDE domain
MTTPVPARNARYRFPAEIIGHAVWLYFRFPLGLRMVEELLAARGIIVSHETVRQWARKFGQQFANQIRRRLPRAGDKWHLDEVVLKISGMKHWLWRAVDQSGMVLPAGCGMRVRTSIPGSAALRASGPASGAGDAAARSSSRICSSTTRSSTGGARRPL